MNGIVFELENNESITKKESCKLFCLTRLNGAFSGLASLSHQPIKWLTASISLLSLGTAGSRTRVLREFCQGSAPQTSRVGKLTSTEVTPELSSRRGRFLRNTDLLASQQVESARAGKSAVSEPMSLIGPLPGLKPWKRTVTNSTVASAAENIFP